MKLTEMKVQDIMETNVTTVAPQTPVRELTRLLAERGISGVPVVAGTGEVVGVASATDVVRLAAEEAEARGIELDWPAPRSEWDEENDNEEDEFLASYFMPEQAAPMAPDWMRLGDQAFDDLTVEDIMTPVSFSMPPTATVRDLADFLLRGRIHRAIVTEGDHLVGIVTTMDVLRALTDAD